MLNESTLRDLAHAVLHASRADETEVVLLATHARLTRFANNEIHQNVAEHNLEVRIRVVKEKRVGIAIGNGATREAVLKTLEQAETLAATTPPTPDWPGLPHDPRPTPETLTWSDATAEATPETRADLVGSVCRTADAAGQVASGALETNTQALYIANSHGVERYVPRTVASFVTVVMSDTGSGYAAGAHRDLHAIPIADLGREAVETATRSRNPIDLEPGVYDVVLDAYAVADILSFVCSLGFSGQAFAEGRSFVSGKLGEQVLGENITIIDDGLSPDGLPLPIDFEGGVRQQLPLVENGVARAVAWDSRWAVRAGTESTGHALPAPNWWGPVPLHPHLAPGETPRDALMRHVERGLYITRFNYTRTVNPGRVIVTGLTRDGAFLIENGEIVAPIKNLRFTQSYVEALQNVVALSRERRTLASFGTVGAMKVPAAVIRHFTFTGKTQF